MLLQKSCIFKSNVAAFGQATPLRSVQPFRSAHVVRAEVEPERFRLHNLSPQEGSRRANKRKGRGYGGHQGGTCGFGSKGQKARSGSGTRPGFEGGQTPLYRRLPKLRGIAGGMGAGLSKHVVVNLDDLEKNFEAGAEVSLDGLLKRNLLHISGRESDLPLKVLGSGQLTKPLKIKAGTFSATALEKIKAAGGDVTEVPKKKKWTRAGHKHMVADLAAKGLDYKKEQAKKKAAAAKAKAAKKV